MQKSFSLSTWHSIIRLISSTQCVSVRVCIYYIVYFSVLVKRFVCGETNNKRDNRKLQLMLFFTNHSWCLHVRVTWCRWSYIIRTYGTVMIIMRAYNSQQCIGISQWYVIIINNNNCVLCMAVCVFNLSITTMYLLLQVEVNCWCEWRSSSAQFKRAAATVAAPIP